MVVGMVYESIGKTGGEYVKVIFSLFMFILICNVIGLVPYSYTVTAQIVVTLTLALGVWLGKLYIGVKRHGLKLMGMFIPSGIGIGMVPFFVFVEIIGFIIPIVSLSVRLFANMLSGHVLLKVLFGFSWGMLMSGGLLMIGHVIPLGVLFCLIGLEIAVAMIQAYVFTLLTCIYIGDMVSGGH
jgi:F-type H+-transporting ATPase subunit a